MSEMDIHTSETIETLDKKEKDWHEICGKLEEYKAMAREQDEWKKKYDEQQITFKKEEIKHLKEFYMAKVGQILPEVLATVNSDGSKDASSRTKTQELCIPREPVASPQTSQSASSHRNTISQSAQFWAIDGDVDGYFCRGVGVGLTHTENLMIKKNKIGVGNRRAGNGRRKG